MDCTYDQLNNIFSKEILQTHLTFLALFVGMYESFVDLFESRVESFLCDVCSLDKNGNLKYKKSEEYKHLIEKHKVDDLGNKKPLKATMLWFVDEGALTLEDYNLFITIKNKRDKYVHQMIEFLWNGLTEADVELLMSFLDVFCKLDKWWINEIEIPIVSYEIHDDYDHEGVESLCLLSFKLIINVLYGDKSEEYMVLLKKYMLNRI